jgi:hypothetical protein
VLWARLVIIPHLQTQLNQVCNGHVILLWLMLPRDPTSFKFFYCSIQILDFDHFKSSCIPTTWFTLATWIFVRICLTYPFSHLLKLLFLMRLCVSTLLPVLLWCLMVGDINCWDILYISATLLTSLKYFHMVTITGLLFTIVTHIWFKTFGVMREGIK